MPTQSTIDITDLDNVLLIVGENLGESMIDGIRFGRSIKLRRLALAQDWASDVLVDDMRVSLLSYSTIDLVSGTKEYEISAATRAILDYITDVRIKLDADGDYYEADRVSENEMGRIIQEYSAEDLDSDEDSIIATAERPVYCISEGVRDDDSGNKIFSFKIKIMPEPDEAVTDGLKLMHYNMPELIGYPQNDDETSFSLHKKCVRLLIQYATAELKRVDKSYREADTWEGKAMRTVKEFNDLYRGKFTGNQKSSNKVYQHF